MGQNTRDDILDAYKQININITTQYNIHYLDTRTLFQSNLPPNWSESRGYLTVDGEHHNAQGAKLIIDMFTILLMKYIDDDRKMIEQDSYFTWTN